MNSELLSQLEASYVRFLHTPKEMTSQIFIQESSADLDGDYQTHLKDNRDYSPCSFSGHIGNNSMR